MNFNILTNCCSSPQSILEESNLPIGNRWSRAIGLAAAAHLSAKNEQFLIFEAGPIQ